MKMRPLHDNALRSLETSIKLYRNIQQQWTWGPYYSFVNMALVDQGKRVTVVFIALMSFMVEE